MTPAGTAAVGACAEPPLPPLWFGVPASERSASAGAPLIPEVPAGCDPTKVRALPPALLDELLPAAAAGGHVHAALYADGQTYPLEVIGAYAQGRDVFLGARLAAACPERVSPLPSPAPPTAARADGGTAGPAAAPAPVDGGAGGTSAAPSVPSPGAACATPPPAGAPLALLPFAPAVARPAPALDLALLPGTVRRVIGRKSVAARGRFVGPGDSVAAVFKLRGPTFPMAIFSDGAALRMHRTLGWRKSRPVRARPLTLLVIPGLGGTPAAGAQTAGQDGLLLVGEGDDGPVYQVIDFLGDRPPRTYPE